MNRNFLDICDVSSADLSSIINLGLRVKKNPQDYFDKLGHKKLILLLEKSSTRTRVSFEFAIKELGGHCCVLNSSDSQLSRGETIDDTAKLFDRYADAIAFRTHSHERLVAVAKNCKQAAVINALTDHSHPCQIMADVMTVIEHQGGISKKKVAWIGDVNNVLQSWIEVAEKLDFTVNVCCPKVLKDKIPDSKNCQFVGDKLEAVKGCDVVTTDTWVSMGEDKQKADLFKGLTVDLALMGLANKGAIFLHCLPAYRGYEVSEEIMDNNKHSTIIFDEAENRLHIQKAILMYCLGVI